MRIASKNSLRWLTPAMVALALVTLNFNESKAQPTITYVEDFQDQVDPTIPGFSSSFLHAINGPNWFFDMPFFGAVSPPHALFMGAATNDVIVFDLKPGEYVEEASVWMTGTGGGFASVTFVGTFADLTFDTTTPDLFQKYTATEVDIGEITAIILGEPVPPGPGHEAYYDDITIHVNTSNVLKGDVNFDGAINLLDVGPFVNLVANGVYCSAADVNCDGMVDLLDIGPFIALFN